MLTLLRARARAKALLRARAKMRATTRVRVPALMEARAMRGRADPRRCPHPPPRHHLGHALVRRLRGRTSPASPTAALPLRRILILVQDKRERERVVTPAPGPAPGCGRGVQGRAGELRAEGDAEFVAPRLKLRRLQAHEDSPVTARRS